MGEYIGYIIPVVIVLLVTIIVICIETRNIFVVLRNRVKDKGAQIDVELKRRYDLIPNLVSIVQGQAGFEKSTLEAVIQARRVAINSENLPETLKANDALTGELHRLLAVAENYPKLMTNVGFLQLQEELSVTETKIEYSRQFYNDTVMIYNNTIQMFPASIIAGICKFSEQPFLSADEKERKNVLISADVF